MSTAAQTPSLASKGEEHADSTAEMEKPTVTEGGGEKYATGTKLVLIAVAINLFVFLVALDQTIVSTAVPAIVEDFQEFQVGWYGSAYLLTSTAFQPLFGRLFSSFDVKHLPPRPLHL